MLWSLQSFPEQVLGQKKTDEPEEVKPVQLTSSDRRGGQRSALLHEEVEKPVLGLRAFHNSFSSAPDVRDGLKTRS